MAQTGRITGDPDQPHTLVVVFLRGGADGLNMVAPVEDDAYYRLRPRIAIPKDQALPLDGFFRLNPRLAKLLELYANGALAIVHGAGSEDTSRSHFEAQDFMEHGGVVAGGWVGRYLRARPSAGAAPLAAVHIGKTQPESLRGAPAAVAMESFEVFSFGDRAENFLTQLAALYRHETDLLGGAGAQMLSALDKIRALRDADYRPEHGATYPQRPFARGLRQIAQLIKARVGLETASIDLGGWDSHFGAASIMDPLLDQLSEGLAAFCQDLGSRMDNVTVVAMSEFGRRAYENASGGTDHGRGGVMFVLGGGVRGGRVLCTWPGLDGDKLEGPGDLPVLHNYRNVLASILTRHGGVENLNRVFPDFDLAPLDLYA
ncbi:MAG: DUF1501 domain-containing protein [Candidatus Hydrogenedentes bacterium]|nr:DUF1501 domain-containing protein [Candidatus Hydrogenedentota bacterium]